MKRLVIIAGFLCLVLNFGGAEAQQPTMNSKAPNSSNLPNAQSRKTSSSTSSGPNPFSGTWWDCQEAHDRVGFGFDADGHVYRLYFEGMEKLDPSPQDHWRSHGNTVTWITGSGGPGSAPGTGTLENGKLLIVVETQYEHRRDSCIQIPNPFLKSDSEGRRWEFKNHYSRGVVIELRDGSTGTGQECDSNELVDNRSLASGESATYSCGSHVGFCVRWKYANPDAEYTAWSGVACVGSNPIWKRFNNHRIDAF